MFGGVIKNIYGYIMTLGKYEEYYFDSPVDKRSSKFSFSEILSKTSLNRSLIILSAVVVAETFFLLYILLLLFEFF